MEILPYHNLYVGMIEILDQVFQHNAYTAKALEKNFKKNPLWGSRDRGFVAEMVYDMVRWKRMIDYTAGGALKKKHYWDFIAAWIIINDQELPDLEEFGKVNYDKLKGNHRQAYKNPAVAHSISDELYTIGHQELGEHWLQELEAMNKPAPAIFRINTLKTTGKELKQSFKKQGIEIEKIAEIDHAFQLIQKVNLFQTEEFKKGWFEMQDVNSQKVAPFVDVQPGLRVADTCAGAGGKSLHLANLMENKGQIVAMDIFEWKLKELKRRAKRNGAHNIQTKLIDSSKVLKRFYGSFDRVLIDAPCSGLGVLKRNPDAKYKIDQAFLDRVRSDQKEILNSYHKLLKSDGQLIYVTCSILPSENEEQVQSFLNEHPEYELIDQQHLLPSETGYDGFYMAKLQKKR